MKNGTATSALPKGMGTSSMAQIQRNPRTLTRVAATRAHGVTIDPSSADLAAASAFRGLVETNHEWAMRSKRRHQQAKEDLADLPA